MNELWQGLLITVLGGLILTIIIGLFKYAGSKIKAKRTRISKHEIKKIEDDIYNIRKAYKTATAFYKDFENASWLSKQSKLKSISKPNQRILKREWLKDIDFTISYDHSNIDLMRMQIISKVLRKKDLEAIISKPVVDNYGNDQAAGTEMFIRYMKKENPRKISHKVDLWLSNNEEGKK
mgnify:CR=1 FL=1